MVSEWMYLLPARASCSCIRLLLGVSIIENLISNIIYFSNYRQRAHRVSVSDRTRRTHRASDATGRRITFRKNDAQVVHIPPLRGGDVSFYHYSAYGVHQKE